MINGSNAPLPVTVPEARDADPMVACVLVTWNNWAYTDRCLAALLQQSYAQMFVIVVDNGSTDRTLDELRSRYPSVFLIENGSNQGFARACNAGARAAFDRGAELVWFLNNDTEAPPETLRRLVEEADKDPRLGVIGAVLRYMHKPHQVQAWGGGWIDLWSGYNRHFTGRSRLGPGSYVTFASALVRRQTFQELRGLWEEIFMYFEDSDFSLRATRAGWGLAVAENTAILHVESGSRPQGERRSPQVQRIETRSGVLFLRRHGPIPLLSVAIFLLLRLGNRIVQRDWAALPAVLAGARNGWRVPHALVRKNA